MMHLFVRGARLLLLSMLLLICSCSNASSNTPYPLPSANRSLFVNGIFHYVFQYPSDWSVATFENSERVRLYYQTSQSHTDAFALDVLCSANSGKLDLLDWWNQSPYAKLANDKVVSKRLSNGVVTLMSHGSGQTSYTMYATATGDRACVVFDFTSPQSLQSYVDSTAQSFLWT